MSLVTPLNRVLGLGSAKDGVEHWWRQRLTAVALMVLGAWLAIALATMGDYSYSAVAAWLGRPLNAVLLILTLLALTSHSQLGVQVVIEDYVHARGIKLVSLALATFAHWALAIAGVFAVLKIAFGAAG
jgi:succinate dehydrogenase / fumarate reductase membrane anchor subunit